MICYLDNSATTKVCEEALEAALKVMKEGFGNPSSMHSMGFEAEQTVNKSAECLAGILGCDRGEIVFTSGGTESDNLAIIGASLAASRRGKHVITTRIEHPAVRRPFEYLEKQGFEVTYLGVDPEGVVSCDELENALRDDTVLVSVMHVNNEIGSVQPLKELGAIIKKKNPGCLFHVDDVQGFTKLKISPRSMNIDLLSVSGHKIHAPKGTGFLYVKKRTRLEPLMLGGGQQGGLRSGTENVPGIAAMAAAAKMLCDKGEEDRSALYELRKDFVLSLSDIEDIKINGAGSLEHYQNGTADEERFAPHIISLSVKSVRAEVLLHSLEEADIFVSAGSACSSHRRAPSEVLTAIGLEKDLLESTVRLSMSRYTTKEELCAASQRLHEIIPALRRFVRR